MSGKKLANSGKLEPIKYLNASGPYRPLKDKLMLLGQFVGDWDIAMARGLQEDGSWKNSRGEFHSGWILGGTAIQDIWKSNENGIRDTGGTTIHFYDQELNSWYSVWISPHQSTVLAFVGNKKGKNIVLESKVTNKKILKWVFYDKKPDSFKWRSESSVDGGDSWLVTEEMLLKRQKNKAAATR